ncbi:MAG: hypothetical protein ACK5WD_05525 [bacterium]
MLPTPMAPALRVASLFSAVTSAMQPARFPLAIFAVVLLSALVPLVDLAGGTKFGPRGFSGGALTESEQALDEHRARSAARRFAGPELAAIEGAGAGAGEAVDGERTEASLAQLSSAVREATARRIAEIEDATQDSPSDFRESEIRRIRQSAATVMRQIEEAGPRGVATVFVENQRLAVTRIKTALFALDPEGFLTGILSAVFTVPAAAIRAEPLAFPLALLVLICAISFCSGGLSRMAAVHAGRRGRLSVLEGSGFARARILNLIALPVLPLALFALFAAVILAFALLLRIPVLNLVSGILFVIPLAVALLGAVLALVALVAAPLMPAAVAVEDCDAGDAITRACALVLGRPLAWLLALSLFVVVLTLGTILVAGILMLASTAVEGLLGLAGGTVGQVLASGDASLMATLSGPDRLISLLVGFWGGIFQMLGAAYGFSLACDLATRGYLLLRERLNGESPATIAGYGLGEGA